jgi:hypothetical protein
MSQSNAAAIRRRTTPAQAGSPTTPPSLPGQPGRSTPATSVASPPTQGLTLQQVITTFDKRINKLETDLQSMQSTPTAMQSSSNTNNIIPTDDIPSILSEFNSRFEMIAEEISSIKDVLMKLQSFTMEVNKAMYDERIHILSDLGNSVAGSTVDNRLNAVNIQNDGGNSPTSIDLKTLANSEIHQN